MSTPKSKTSKRKAIISVLLITVVIAVTGVIFKQEILAKYYYYFKLKHCNKGDKVYVLSELVDYKHNIIGFYRMVRPLSNMDIDEMDIDKLKKASLKNQIDPSLKPYLIQGYTQIYTDTLYKYKTAYIGTYLYYKVLDFKRKDTGEILSNNFYAIEPDPERYPKDIFNDHDYYLPDGYTWADDTMYLPADWADNKEYNKFK